LSYDDECTIFTIAYTDSRDSDDESVSDWTIGARLTFRTLGDTQKSLPSRRETPMPKIPTGGNVLHRLTEKEWLQAMFARIAGHSRVSEPILMSP
ncbi:hypothetical protein ACC811_36535, partial [Rhizobium ruizarguesonis]